MTINMLAMHRDALGPLTPYSCLSAVAVSWPKRSKLFAAYVAFLSMPAPARHRALCSVHAAARLTARTLKLRKARPGEPAWGVVEGRAGAACFAACTGPTWWARSERGIGRVHPSRVLDAWELA